MAKASNADLILGIVLIVIGALMLLGKLGIPFLEEILGIAALVVGILILIGRVGGATWMGVALVVVGVLILATRFLDFITGTVADIINIVLGIILVVFGILKVMGKR